MKTEILQNLCYTELVYDRIQKKLETSYTRDEIESMLHHIILKTEESHFEKRGKNFYITNTEHHIRITVNSNTFRIITVDRVEA